MILSKFKKQHPKALGSKIKIRLLFKMLKFKKATEDCILIYYFKNSEMCYNISFKLTTIHLLCFIIKIQDNKNAKVLNVFRS
jgi:hypothetical protein